MREVQVREFCCWLQGYFELTMLDGYLSADQVKVIKWRLRRVFTDDGDTREVSRRES